MDVFQLFCRAQVKRNSAGRLVATEGLRFNFSDGRVIEFEKLFGERQLGIGKIKNNPGRSSVCLDMIALAGLKGQVSLDEKLMGLGIQLNA
jgi:hypothetical protein